jgi:hypothetical protein
LACQEVPIMRFGPQWTEIGCSSFKSKHYLQTYRNNMWKTTNGSPAKKSHLVKE